MNSSPFFSRLSPLLVLCVVVSTSWAQTISTVAGTGSQGNSGDGGAPTAAQLHLPSSIGADEEGNLYIADTGNNRIRRINAQRDTIETVAGTGTANFSGDGGAALSAEFDAPAGVFVDSSGLIYIADTGNNRIRRIDGSGNITTIAGSDTTAGLFIDDTTATSATLNAPTAVFARGEYIYIADTGNNRIRRIDGVGNITTIAGSDTTAGLFIDDTTATSATLLQPRGLYVDRTHNVYIADTDHHRIRKLGQDSVLTTVAGSGKPGFSGDGDLPTNARLAFPTAVAVDTFGTVYIADRFNHRIRRINPTGDITTIAGLGPASFSGDDGPANRAELSSPSGLLLRSDTLFIADQSNHRIRKILPDYSVGLSGQTALGPGRETVLLRIRLTGDGQTTINGLRFTLSDLSTETGLSADDFSAFFLYESTDTALGDDVLLGRLDAADLVINSQTTIPATTYSTPQADATRYYLLTARLSSTSTQGHAMRIGVETGSLLTNSGGRGARIYASDTHRLEIDATATQLVLRAQPGNSLSGALLTGQLIVEAIDDSGFVDFDFRDTLAVSTDGSGTLLHNTTIADSGLATFTHLTYSTGIDDEPIILTVQNTVDAAHPTLLSAQTETIYINVENDPPVVDFPTLVFTEDEALGFRTLVRSIATDVDDAELTLTFKSHHMQASVVGDSVIVVPEANFFGFDTLTVTATDAFGLEHSDSGIIEVRSVNDAPVFSFPERFTFAEDETLRVDMRSWLSDVDDAFDQLHLAFTPSSGLSHRYSGQAAELTLWATPNANGAFTLQAKAEDPYATTAQVTVPIVIAERNDPPQLALRDTTIIQGASIQIDLASATADIDDPLSALQWTVQPDSLVSVEISANGQATLQPHPDVYGVRTLVFSALDLQQASASDTLQLEILRVNQPPALESLPDLQAAPGDSVHIDLTVYGSDPDDAIEQLIWSVSSSGSIGTTLDDGQLHLRIPADASEHSEEIYVRVFDPLGFSAQDTFRIDVRLPVPPIAPLPDLVIEPGRILYVDLRPYLSAEVDSVTATHDSLLVDIDLAKRQMTVRPVDGYKRTTPLILHARTAQGLVATDTVLVSMVNPAPRLTSFDDLYLDAGTSIQLALDPFAWDDEPVSRLRWSALPDAGLQVSIHGTLHVATIRSNDDASGLRRIAFTATDAQGASATDTLHIYIHASSSETVPESPNNTAPRLSTIPAQQVAPGVELRIPLDSYVTDDGPLGQLTWSVSTSADQLLRVDIDSLRTARVVALQDSGRIVVELRATDSGGLQNSTQFEVTIMPAQPASRVGDFNENGRVDLDDFFRLAESIGLTPLHYEWDPAIDLDYDGQITLDDFFIFADAFAADQHR